MIWIKTLERTKLYQVYFNSRHMCSVYRITPNKELQLELIKKQFQNEGSFLKIPSDFTTGAGQDGATPDFVSYPNIHYPPTSNASILAIVLIHCWNTGTSFYLFSFSYFIILLSIFHKAIEWLFHYRNWITLYLTFKYLSRIQNLCTQPSILSPEFFLSYLTTHTGLSVLYQTCQAHCCLEGLCPFCCTIWNVLHFL